MMFNRKNTGLGGRMVPLVTLTAAAALALTGCAGGGGTQGETSAPVEEQKITFIPKQLNNPYTDVVLG
ncbi:MAG TPA: rhamnose ABC transporter substrate-binding protein, partial [Arthrobacter sp.]